jgi:hypothetical protein
MLKTPRNGNTPPVKALQRQFTLMTGPIIKPITLPLVIGSHSRE